MLFGFCDDNAKLRYIFAYGIYLKKSSKGDEQTLFIPVHENILWFWPLCISLLPKLILPELPLPATTFVVRIVVLKFQ